jgi:hypothetical protein
MTSIADSPVTIQISAQCVPATPCWFGEVALIAHYLRQQGVFALIEQRVRFARRRFGHYDLIDFVAVLPGYAISGERTLEIFEALLPFADAFLALFGRERLPDRSTLSRFLSALDQAPVEALRTLFLEDWLARPLEKEEPVGRLWDRQGRGSTGWSSILMAPDKRPANALCQPPLICRPSTVGCKRSALLVMWDASAAKWCARAVRCCWRSSKMWQWTRYGFIPYLAARGLALLPHSDRSAMRHHIFSLVLMM